MDSRLPNVIDSLLIDLDNLQLGADYTEEMTFTGFHDISHMTMSFRVECSPGFCGPNCTTLPDNIGVDECQANGTILCVHGWDPLQNCSECLNGRNLTTNCTTCLPGFSGDCEEGIVFLFMVYVNSLMAYTPVDATSSPTVDATDTTTPAPPAQTEEATSSPTVDATTSPTEEAEESVSVGAIAGGVVGVLIAALIVGVIIVVVVCLVRQQRKTVTRSLAGNYVSMFG